MFYLPPPPDRTPERRQPTAPPPPDEIRRYAIALQEAGAPPEEILEKLLESGVELEQAMPMVSRLFSSDVKKGKQRNRSRSEIDAERKVLQLEEAYKQALLNSGKRNIWIGGVVCAIGLVVTLGSLTTAAASDTGGRIIIAWGAIVFGGIQLARGLGQVGQGKAASS